MCVCFNPTPCILTRVLECWEFTLSFTTHPVDVVIADRLNIAMFKSQANLKSQGSSSASFKMAAPCVLSGVQDPTFIQLLPNLVCGLCFVFLPVWVAGGWSGGWDHLVVQTGYGACERGVVQQSLRYSAPSYHTAHTLPLCDGVVLLSAEGGSFPQLGEYIREKLLQELPSLTETGTVPTFPNQFRINKRVRQGS